jgi:acyl-CoA synthetase (AMP-forming)/AMP-acid ligase II
MLYTSGTTGKPKGAELSHRALLGQMSRGGMWPSELRRDEAVVALPVAHIMGFGTLLGFACAGIPVYFVPHFRPDDVLDAIEKRRATIFIGVPAMYRLMLEAGAEDRNLRSVRVWGSGADVMPDELARRFQRMGATIDMPLIGPVGQALFMEGYGMVEAGAVATKITPPLLGGLVRRLLPDDALGVRLPGYEMKVVGDDGRSVLAGEVGELWVRGPGVLRGYHGDAAATNDVLTPDGWLRTGDLARIGPLGTIRFAGRKKHVIKHGGYSVYAVEVEAVLNEHPEIAEAAVIGLPDERKGEIPAAVVRLHQGATVTPEGLVEWAAGHLAEYKAPQRIVVVDELPRTGTAKVQKQRLLDLF